MTPGPAVLCAVPAERAALVRVRGLGVVHAGGVGPGPAGRAARELLARGPSALIAAGFCGALDPDLRIAELIAAREVIDAATGERFQADPGLLSAAPGLRAVLSSTPSLVRSPDVRAGLPGAAVDMESAAVARAAAEAGVPFLALRSVTDRTHHRMPDISRAVAPNGTIQMWPLARSAARRPTELGRLLRLAATSARAARSLRRGLQIMVDRL